MTISVPSITITMPTIPSGDFSPGFGLGSQSPGAVDGGSATVGCTGGLEITIPSLGGYSASTVALPQITEVPINIATPPVVKYTSPGGDVTYDTMPSVPSPALSSTITFNAPSIPSPNIVVAPIQDITVGNQQIQIPAINLPPLIASYINLTLSALQSYIRENENNTEDVTVNEVEDMGTNTIKNDSSQLALTGSTIQTSLENEHMNKDDNYSKVRDRNTTNDVNNVGNTIGYTYGYDNLIGDVNKIENTNIESIRYFGNYDVLLEPINILYDLKFNSLSNKYITNLQRYKDVYILPESSEISDINDTQITKRVNNKVEVKNFNSTYKKIEQKVIKEMENFLHEIIERGMSVSNSRINETKNINKNETQRETQVEINQSRTLGVGKKIYSRVLNNTTDLSGLTQYANVMAELAAKDAIGDIALPYFNECAAALAANYDAQAFNYSIKNQEYAAYEDFAQAVVQRNNQATNLYESLISKYISIVDGVNSAAAQLLNKGMDINDKFISIFGRFANIVKELNQINDNNFKAYNIAASSFFESIQAEVKAAQSLSYEGKAMAYSEQAKVIPAAKEEINATVEKYNAEILGAIAKASQEATALNEIVGAFQSSLSILSETCSVAQGMINTKIMANDKEAYAIMKDAAADHAVALARLQESLASLVGQIAGARVRSGGLIQAAAHTQKGGQGQIDGAVRRANAYIRAAQKNAEAQIRGTIYEVIAGI